MRKLRTAFISTLALGLAFSIGCGGGGGGSSTPVTPVVYNGLTSQAEIHSAADAQRLTAGALGSAGPGSVVLAATSQAQPEAPLPGTLPGLVSVLGKVAAQAKPVTGLAAGATYTDTIYGNCARPGYANLSGSGSSTSAGIAATGTITFVDYCDIGSDGTSVTFNGTASFSLAGNSADDFSIRMSTTRLSVTMGGQNFIYSMIFSSSYYYGASGTVSLDCDFLAPDGKTYRVAGYQILGNETYRTLAISGTFYDPDYGYVVVSTVPALAFNYCSNKGTFLPTAGNLRVTGANGVYGEFDPVDCTNYYLTVGNGVSSTQYPQTW